MIKLTIDLTMDVIESSVEKYVKGANPFYEASYDLIKNKRFWDDFNGNWVDKLMLVYSWMPRIAGRDSELEIQEGESFEACIQRNCREVLDSDPGLNRNIRLVDVIEEKLWDSLKNAYDFTSKVTGQVGASKILHFSFPSLCLMWDNDQIKKLFGLRSRKLVNGSDYVEYHR
ncbi:MAG: hypothetical protein A2144_05065 [Chloroflexi bacterium RBG_16_50_9]|nr:MAG: hypothetical protein A2144_05065 [Chloroflexi bacterium RBG_16_50_9]